MYVCTICDQFAGRSFTSVLRHIGSIHRFDPGLSIRCGIKACPETIPILSPSDLMCTESTGMSCTWMIPGALRLKVSVRTPLQYLTILLTMTSRMITLSPIDPAQRLTLIYNLAQRNFSSKSKRNVSLHKYLLIKLFPVSEDYGVKQCATYTNI